MEQEIREALGKATKGPFEVTNLGDIHITKGYEQKDGFHVAQWIADICCDDEQDEEQALADAYLLANAPTYLEWCLSQIAELRKENRRLLRDREEEEFRPRFRMDAHGNLTRIEEED